MGLPLIIDSDKQGEKKNNFLNFCCEIMGKLIEVLLNITSTHLYTEK